MRADLLLRPVVEVEVEEDRIFGGIDFDPTVHLIPAGVVVFIVRVGDARMVAVLLERPDGEKTVLLVVRDLHRASAMNR